MVPYGFLDHIHNFLLNKIQALRVSSRSSANDIVHLNVIILLSDSTSIHGIGELDKHGIFLHDSLNVLSSNPNNAFMILVWHMKGD
jgi:hypothetical protein